jgi:hypothetical protein
MIKIGMETSPDFPFDKSTKRKKDKPHMLDVALKENNIQMISPDVVYFELGNENAERLAPHYHILEDSKTIRMPNRGTTTTKGSQATKPKNKRDYSVYLPPQEKTNRLTQEYRQSYTSGRRSYAPATKRLRDLRDKTILNKKKLPYRYNKHFAYIERILENILPNVASLLNLTLITPKGNMQQLYQNQNGEITSTPPFNQSTGEIIGG